MADVLSVKDYFHYYFSGFVWLLDMWLVAGHKISLNRVLNLLSQAPPSLVISCIIVCPFVIGFAFNPFGNCITLLIRKFRGGDPADWMLVLRGETYKGSQHKRLAEPWRSALLSKIESIAGTHQIKYSPFFWVRTYVDLNAPSHTRQRIERVLSLANFTESLLLPFPLLVFLLLRQNYCSVGASLSAALFLLLGWRYWRLRIYWVQHVYRAFYFLHTSENAG